jgi:hypothetical protein
VGCAGGQAHTHRSYGGDVMSAPALEALPSLDVEEVRLSGQMRMARLLSAESLALSKPEAPTSSATAAITRWSDSELKRWVTEKHRRAEAARKELDGAAVNSHRERIMAGALVGLVYEDVARALLALPFPTELASEPEVRAIFEDVLRGQAAPYLVHARLAYQACAANALGLSAMAHWSEFCQGRGAELPEAGAEQRDASLTVSVSKR